MKLFKEIVKVNFHKTFFEQESLPELYSKISLNINETSLNIPFKPLQNKTNKKKVIVEYFPNYLTAEIHKNYRKKSIFQKKGYAVDLTDYDSIENYFTSNVKKSSRKTIARAIKRLELCFDVSYKMYYGSIKGEKYNCLMDSLFEMLHKRFKTRNVRNRDLENEDYYRKLFWELINQKKASLFVIYDNLKAIEIALNYHHEEIIYSAISSFDSDYSKFSLGNVEIYKQLQWCFENNIDIFDMGYGSLLYKQNWSNLVYDFEAHVTTSNVFDKIMAFFHMKKYSLINFVIDKKLNEFYYKLKKPLKTGSTENVAPKKFTFSKIETPNYEQIENLAVISNIENRDYDLIRECIYDFLYSNSERIDSIRIYEQSPEQYVIKYSESFYKINQASG